LPDEQHHRVAPLVTFDEPTDPAIRELMAQFIGPDTMIGKALSAPGGAFAGAEVFNDPRVWRAEVPAANGITDARSLARLYAALSGTVEGGPAEPILTAEQIAAASECQTSGADQVIMMETTIGLGFWTASPFAPYGGAKAIGHGGAGGSLGFTDPEHGIGFGYVMNKMQQGLSGDPRTRTLITALYDAIGAEAVYV
jgi:CubicO group peptidase (beta-lactamase class C family)